MRSRGAGAIGPAILGAFVLALLILPGTIASSTTTLIPPFAGLKFSERTSVAASGCGFASTPAPFTWNNTTATGNFSIGARAGACKIVKGNYSGFADSKVRANIRIPLHLAAVASGINATLGFNAELVAKFNKSLQWTFCPASPYNASGNCTAYAGYLLAASVAVHDTSTGAWFRSNPLSQIWYSFSAYVSPSPYCYWDGWFCPAVSKMSVTTNVTYPINGSFSVTDRYVIVVNFSAKVVAYNLGYDGHVWARVVASGPGQGFRVESVDIR